MFGSKKQKQIISEDELAIEMRLNSRQIKKLDKLYIALACMLIVGWGTWTLGGFNFLKSIKLPGFSFITDYFNHKSWDKNVKYVSSSSIAGLCGDSIVYANYETRELFSLKRDGSGSKRLLNNFSDGGFYIYDGWIYYYEGGKGIMKMLPDGSEKTEVMKVDPRNYRAFNILDGNIYYYAEDNGYYRTSLDGSNKKLLLYLSNGILEAYPYSNWVYYFDAEKHGIFRTKIGEKENKLVADIKGKYISQLSVYRDHIYYAGENAEFFMCDLDGSNETKIDTEVISYTIQDKTLYYTKMNPQAFTNPEENSVKSVIMSSNLNGSNKKVIFSGDGYMHYIRDNIYFSRETLSGDSSFRDIGKNITISVPEPKFELLVKNWKERLKYSSPGRIISGINNYTNLVMDKEGFIYFADSMGGNGIIKYKKGLDKPIKLTEENARNLKLLGNALFYISQSDNQLYVLNTNWPGAEKVFDFQIMDYIPMKDGIYFRGSDSKLYKADFNTGKVEKLLNDRVMDFQIQDDYIYFAPPIANGGISRIKLDGTSREDFKPSFTLHNFIVNGDYIYFRDIAAGTNSNLYSLARAKFGLDRKEVLISNLDMEFNLSDRHIIYVDYTASKSGMPPIYVYDLDGSNKRELGFQRGSFNYFFNGDKIYNIEYPGVVKEYNINQLINK